MSNDPKSVKAEATFGLEETPCVKVPSMEVSALQSSLTGLRSKKGFI